MFAGQIELQTATSSTAVADEMREQDLAQFPNDLHICCIDDSAAARRLLHFNLTQWGRTENVHIFGKDETEASEFVRKTVAVGRIAILDQHLEYGGESSLLGTGPTHSPPLPNALPLLPPPSLLSTHPPSVPADLVELLVAKQFQGLICMRSGNASAHDMAKYRNAGAHCIFGKDVSMRKMIEDMKVAYVRHVSDSELRLEDVMHADPSDSPRPRPRRISRTSRRASYLLNTPRAPVHPLHPHAV